MFFTPILPRPPQHKNHPAPMIGNIAQRKESVNDIDQLKWSATAIIYMRPRQMWQFSVKSSSMSVL